MHRERLADAVALAHKLLILLMAAGVLWAKSVPSVRAPIAIAFWTILVGNVLWWGCPLTRLEETLRGKRPREDARPGSFIARILRERVGIAVPAWCVTLTLLALAGFTTFLWLS